MTMRRSADASDGPDAAEAMAEYASARDQRPPVALAKHDSQFVLEVLGRSEMLLIALNAKSLPFSRRREIEITLMHIDIAKRLFTSANTNEAAR